MSVTIKDVAREAHTSPSTVSRVMNKPFLISEKTCKDVKEAMTRLGYHPNRRAQNLVNKRTFQIAYFQEFEDNGAYLSPHKFEILSGIQNALEKKGYSLLFSQTNAANTISKFEEMSLNRQIDGVVIHASCLSHELEKSILKSGIPYIVIGRPPHKTDLSWVDNDNYISGKIAARFVILSNKKNVIFLNGKAGDEITNSRLRGMKDGIGESIFTKPKFEHIDTDDTIEGAEKAIESLISSNRIMGYDIIVCANNFLAFGTMMILSKSGIKVPDAVSVLTFDDYPFALFTSPKLTSISIDMFNLGSNAANMLLEKIKHPEINIQTYITLPVLVRRGSTTN